MNIKFNNLRSLFLLVLTLVSVAVQAAEEKSVKTASATAKGAPPAVLFQKYCSICHGENGNGKTRVVKSMDPRPRDFTAPAAVKDLTRERMIKSVTNGRPGTAMVAHKRKLNTEEIASIVDYIRSTFMRTSEAMSTTKTSTSVAKPKSVAAAPVMALTEQNLLGKTLFKKNCASCHGDNGNTAIWARSGLDPAPRDFTSAQAKADLTHERMIKSVTNGRSGTAMMPFSSRLSKDEIAAVVSYIRTSFMRIADDQTMPESEVVASKDTKPATVATKDEKPSATPQQIQTPATTEHAKIDMSSPMPNSITGDPAKGQAFYMNNCYICHGKKGDGKGPRSHFITPRPRNFTSDASRGFYNRPQLYEAIGKGKKGTVMPAWEKVLDEQQIADVAEFVFQTFIQVKVDAEDSDKNKGGGTQGTKNPDDNNTSQLNDATKKKASELALMPAK